MLHNNYVICNLLLQRVDIFFDYFDENIRGEHFYRGGATTGIYKEGTVKNIASFYDQISSGLFNYDTVNPSVHSNLVTLLGREAAMRNEQVYWYQLLKSSHRLEPDLSGLKS